MMMVSENKSTVPFLSPSFVYPRIAPPSSRTVVVVIVYRWCSTVRRTSFKESSSFASSPLLLSSLFVALFSFFSFAKNQSDRPLWDLFEYFFQAKSPLFRDEIFLIFFFFSPLFSNFFVFEICFFFSFLFFWFVVSFLRFCPSSSSFLSFLFFFSEETTLTSDVRGSLLLILLFGRSVFVLPFVSLSRFSLSLSL